ncbi:MAG: hypothetical protein LBS41_00170 [Streptococcaceae bacterium]|jgi:hypothetical protein|nr:hypothetical protein [Streptococcaceae bacterium]
MAKTTNLYARIEPEAKERTEQLNLELEKSYAQMSNREGVPLAQAFETLEKAYNL